MSVDPIFWLLAAIGFVVLEAMTLNLVSIWFAVGSAAALLSCLVVASFRVQAVVFIAVSILCLLALKPLCARLRKPPTATNGDRALGREAVVLTPVSAEAAGRVRLDGVDWNARFALPRYRDPQHPAHRGACPDRDRPPGGSLNERSVPMPIMLFLILILIFVVLLVVVTNIVIVPQSMVYVVERLGSYSETWSAGLHVKIPFLERVAKKVSLKEQVADFPPQPVITRDNVTMQIDTVVFFQVMDAKLYTYGVNQPIAAIESLSATTLRNIIGEMELDHTLTSRDTINSKITAILDEATDKWGIKVNRVEVKNIIPPREIQEAMEKQMKAEREKRAVILKADGEKQAAITAAEGEKESAILRADAVKQQRILEAEGEAQAILAVQKANADAIRLLNEAMPTDKVLALRSLEALAKVANGKATKIIIPSDLQNLGGVVPSIKELMTDPKDAE